MMAVFAPDSSTSLETCDACISSVVKVLREGRRSGAKDFHITGFGADVYRDKKDIEELTKIYAPLCWQGYDNGPGGFQENHVVRNYGRI